MNIKVCWLSAALLCSAWSVPAFAAPPKAAKATPSPARRAPAAPAGVGSPEWESFRAVYPFHIQGVAISAPRSDGTRVLVVAEPPPHVGSAALLAVDPTLLANNRIRARPVGLDGWVRDFVAILPRMDNEAVSGLCARINTLLFRTSYKATVLEIPAVAPRSPEIRLGEKGLDLRISTADLQRWLLEDELDLVPGLGGAPAKLRDLLRTGAQGVYFTAQEGLVVWLFPDGVDVATQQFAARQFALDSDLILGAISGDKGTAIIARERVTSLNVLPPLRVETIFQLAAARTAHLAQSYERTNAFAGRYDDSHDWAPIFLSNELIDTEYGSLLNITDQLLKSWSNSGDTKYANFIYPTPSRYPFPQAIMRHLKVNEITYNWNTKGAGYGVEAGPYAILALNRTGALPVSYIPGDGAGAGAVMAAEDTAYNYFAGLGDPNLTRVVQYAGIYQAFMNCKVGTPAPRPPDATPRVNPLLLDEMVRVYERLNAASPAQLATLAAPLIEKDMDLTEKEFAAEIRKLEKQKGVTLPADQRARILDEAMTENRKKITSHYVEKLSTSRNTIRARVAASPNLREGLGDFLVSQEGEAEQLAADYLRSITDLVAIRDSMVRNGVAAARGWIHTPAVVVSWNVATGESVNYIGGHNLDATISVFRTDPTQPKGSIKLLTTKNGGETVVFNPADRDRVTQIVRDVGRRESDLTKLWPEVERRFAASVAPPIRPLRTALGFPERAPGALPGRGLRRADTPSAPGIGGGWELRNASAIEGAETVAFQAAAEKMVVTINPKPPGFAAIFGEGATPRVVSGPTKQAVTDAIRELQTQFPRQGEIYVRFGEGVGELDALNFTRSIRASDAGRHATGIKSARLTPKRLGELTHTHYDLAKIKFEPMTRREIGGGMELGHSFSAPAKVAAEPSLFGRVVTTVKGKLPESVVTKIDASVKNLAARLDRSSTASDVHRVAAELRKEIPEIDTVSTEFMGGVGEAADATFVENTPPPFHFDLEFRCLDFDHRRYVLRYRQAA